MAGVAGTFGTSGYRPNAKLEKNTNGQYYWIWDDEFVTRVDYLHSDDTGENFPLIFKNKNINKKLTNPITNPFTVYLLTNLLIRILIHIFTKH